MKSKSSSEARYTFVFHERTPDERLRGVRLNETHFRVSARYPLNGNPYRDFAVRASQQIVDELDAPHRWADDGGAS